MWVGLTLGLVKHIWNCQAGLPVFFWLIHTKLCILSVSVLSSGSGPYTALRSLGTLVSSSSQCLCATVCSDRPDPTLPVWWQTWSSIPCLWWQTWSSIPVCGDRPGPPFPVCGDRHCHPFPLCGDRPGPPFPSVVTDMVLHSLSVVMVLVLPCVTCVSVLGTPAHHLQLNSHSKGNSCIIYHLLSS